MTCGYTEVSPTYPALKAKMQEKAYAAATMTGSLTPHNSRW